MLINLIKKIISLIIILFDFYEIWITNFSLNKNNNYKSLNLNVFIEFELLSLLLF